MYVRFIHRVLLFFLIWAPFWSVDYTIASDEITQTRNGKIFLKARDSTIREIVREFQNKYSIEISGLENRESEKISFSSDAHTLEGLLKGLLRHLNIKNFAIEYADATLKRVVVVPNARGAISDFVTSNKDRLNLKKFVNVAEVQSIIEASQAESLDLLEGDIIIEYDGVPINDARQLVNEVEKKASSDQVEMVIVREKTPRRLILGGGFIGVRVMTRKVLKEEGDTLYLSD